MEQFVPLKNDQILSSMLGPYGGIFFQKSSQF